MRFWKTFSTVLLVIMMTVTNLGVCATPLIPDSNALSAYNYDLYMYPVWAGGAVYQETTVFYVDGNGNVVGGNLLYAPDRILSVRSFGLDKEYQPDVDYIMTDTGIKLTEESGIPVMPRAAYCDESDTKSAHQLKDGNGGKLFTDNTVLPRYYLSVSYTTSATWNGILPKNETDHLSRLKKKLENKEKVTIAVLGDSISVGYTTSGLNDPSYRVNGEKITVKVDIAPHMPTWPKLLCENLRRAYGYEDIWVVNWAIGGTNTSSECLSDMLDRVVSSQPDLVTIGFGMNEYWGPAVQHGNRIEGIMDRLRTSLPDTEFLLLSSMLPNMLAYSEGNMNLAAFETEYYNLQSRRTDLGIAVAPVNAVYRYAQGIKGDFALVGGNQNHPNDFAVRLYAQTISTVLGGYDNTPHILSPHKVSLKAGESCSVSLNAYCTNDVTWKLAEGALPAGLTLSSGGILSGTPTESGTFTFTAEASNGTHHRSADLSITVTDDAVSDSSSKSRTISWPVAVLIISATVLVLGGVVFAVYKMLNK